MANDNSGKCYAKNNSVNRVRTRAVDISEMTDAFPYTPSPGDWQEYAEWLDSVESKEGIPFRLNGQN